MTRAEYNVAEQIYHWCREAEIKLEENSKSLHRTAEEKSREEDGFEGDVEYFGGIAKGLDMGVDEIRALKFQIYEEFLTKGFLEDEPDGGKV